MVCKTLSILTLLSWPYNIPKNGSFVKPYCSFILVKALSREPSAVNKYFCTVLLFSYIIDPKGEAFLVKEKYNPIPFILSVKSGLKILSFCPVVTAIFFFNSRNPGTLYGMNFEVYETAASIPYSLNASSLDVEFPIFIEDSLVLR